MQKLWAFVITPKERAVYIKGSRIKGLKPDTLRTLQKIFFGITEERPYKEIDSSSPNYITVSLVENSKQYGAFYALCLFNKDHALINGATFTMGFLLTERNKILALNYKDKARHLESALKKKHGIDFDETIQLQVRDLVEFGVKEIQKIFNDYRGRIFEK